MIDCKVDYDGAPIPLAHGTLGSLVLGRMAVCVVFHESKYWGYSGGAPVLSDVVFRSVRDVFHCGFLVETTSAAGGSTLKTGCGIVPTVALLEFFDCRSAHTRTSRDVHLDTVLSACDHRECYRVSRARFYITSENSQATPARDTMNGVLFFVCFDPDDG